MSKEERIASIVKSVIRKGFHLANDAFLFLKEIENPEEAIDKTLAYIDALPEKPAVITRDLLEKVLSKEIEITPKVVHRPIAKEIEGKVRVLKNPTKLGSYGEAENFLRYFHSRFEKLKRILRQQPGTYDALTISEALRRKEGERVKTIGMVFNKTERRNLITIELEDLESSAIVMISPENVSAFRKAQGILLDEVICVDAVRGRSDILLAKDIIRPSMRERRPRRSKDPILTVMTSDLHLGSKMFLNNVFERFVNWLIGRVGTRKERELAGRVKYLIIAGDIVDGIGIYPGQERELAITSITKQYCMFAKYLEKIPEYIEVIIIPGNHDATRQALPQPAILRKYADVVYRSRRLYMLGNPAVVELDRMRFLLYHGRSLEDIIGSVRGMDYKHPEEAMRFLLDVRHVGPVYGKATPISPENQDWLVIEEEPDIFHAGHIHVNGYAIHRGVRIVNSGTWQLMTEYQRRLGISPTPGKVPVLDMRTLEVFELNFMSSSLLS